MAQIHNSDTTTLLAKNAGISTAYDAVPTQLAEKIVPTFEANAYLVKPANVCKSASGTAGNSTIYTTPTNVDFYLTSAHLAVDKDATHSNTHTKLCVYPADTNVLVELLAILGTTLVAKSDSVSQSYPRPIKLARGSTITITKVAANGTHFGSITGFTDSAA